MHPTPCIPPFPSSIRPRRLAVCLAALALLAAAPAAAWEPGPAVDPDATGAPTLLWKAPGGHVPLPVLDTAVAIEVTGIVVRGTVTQSFRNPTDEVIEALYVFPLPDGAAVHRMEMRIGPRRITAIVEERQQARRTYETARQEGRKAALVEQDRPNLFTTAAANINPGERIEVIIEYLDEASWSDGAFSLRFPMTFTQRYEPGGKPGNGTVPSAGARSPFMDAAHPAAPRVEVTVRINAGVPLAEVASRSHDMESFLDGEIWEVRPADSPVAADRDLLLAWHPVIADRPAPALLVEDRDDGRYALLMVVPPEPVEAAGWGLPTETLFVVDVSGSMAGSSIEQAREALLAAVERLRPEDTFNLLRFSDRTGVFSETFLAADDDSRSRAAAWVRGLEAGGGTEIFGALLEGLSRLKREDSGRVERLIFLTDGAVGNEEQVFQGIIENLGDVRLHAIGIGNAPNTHLMRKMASFGRGACEFIAARAEAGNRIDAFFSRIDRPVLSDLSLRWSGGQPGEIYPARLPDLYPGEPLLVSFRLEPDARLRGVELLARHRDGAVRHAFEVAPNAAPGAGIATRWARRKVAGLIDLLHEGADPAVIRDEVVRLGIAHRLVTRYTSLVAVEEFVSALDPSRPMQVANGLPAGSRGALPALPRGGTWTPLETAVGILLALLGFVLLRLTATGRPAA